MVHSLRSIWSNIFQRWSLLFLAAILIVIPLAPVSAQGGSNICISSGSNCTEKEVGPFMKGISKQCGNLGNCQLDDMMTVVANVANWVSGIVGVVVFLMYVIGGIFILTSAGNSERVQKGKTMLKVSTIGLIIVMSSYLIVNLLACTLTDGGGEALRNVPGIGNFCGTNR